MNTINVGHVQIAERPWWVGLLGPVVRALLCAACWWLWVWGFKIQDVPQWSFYFAAFVGCFTPITSFYIRKRPA